MYEPSNWTKLKPMARVKIVRVSMIKFLLPAVTFHIMPERRFFMLCGFDKSRFRQYEKPPERKRYQESRDHQGNISHAIGFVSAGPFENFHAGKGKQPGCAHGKQIADKTLGAEQTRAFMVVRRHFHTKGPMRDLENIDRK